ncbi:hypothetical protein ONZ51_g8472 [Trametes cubensis]|uniref:F-box domain-containing protein n=1 Tax=Trametes cubensis TaxID=1111947 RepID=A0AAD7TNH6_9APHY|nr:hypothetical protein ONZ51_g8472 [Trametes cubensis]
MLIAKQGLRERDEAPPVKVVLDNLPPEVLHVIFQHAAHDDKPTILACSLVSWNWREMSLPHLFSSLTVKRSLDYDDFSNFLAEHPNLTRHIRRLVLGFLPKCYSDGLPHATIRPTLTSVDLFQITAKLPRLHTLVLQGVWLAEAPGDIPSLPSVTPRMLEEVVIHGCSAPREEPLPLRALLGILIAYPATTISLQSIFVTFAHLAIIGPASTKHFVDFSLHGVCVPSAPTQLSMTQRQMSYVLLELLSIMLEGRSYDTSNSLSRSEWTTWVTRKLVQVSTRRNLCPVQRGPVINQTDAACGLLDFWRILRLNKCSNLEYIQVNIALVFPWPAPHNVRPLPPVPFTTVCIALLDQLPNTLRTVAFKIRSPDEAYIYDANWLNLQELDEALVARFPSLEQVHVMLHGYIRWVECTRLIRSAMAKCGQRGILSIGGQGPGRGWA